MNASIQLRLAASLPSNANVKVRSFTSSEEVEGRRVYTVLALLVAPPSSILRDREVTMKLDVDGDGVLKTCCEVDWENTRVMKDRKRVKRSMLRCCICIGIEGIITEYEYWRESNERESA